MLIVRVVAFEEIEVISGMTALGTLSRIWTGNSFQRAPSPPKESACSGQTLTIIPGGVLWKVFLLRTGGTGPSNRIVARFVHPLKMKRYMDVTPPGMTMLVRLVQFVKAWLPIEMRFSGREILVRLIQP